MASRRLFTAARRAIAGRSALLAVGASASAAGLLFKSSFTESEAVPADAPSPGNRPGLPIFSRAEIAKHNKPDDLWVTFKDGVYNVTEFQSKHPGGNKILLAAGAAVDPYWAFYQQHQHTHVHEILAKYRIGTLDPKDVKMAQEAANAVGDPYAKDPMRSPFIKAHTTKPFNGEPPAAMLVDHFITPAEVLFVRHHLPVPQVDESKHEITLELQVPADAAAAKAALEPDEDSPVPPEVPVKVSKTVKIKLSDLKSGKKYPITKVIAAITCSGNRRADMARRKEARGLAWDVGAMGNVEWTGVRLRDVLIHELGVKEADTMDGLLKHVQFEGCDVDPAAGTRYAASIPADKALSQWGDVILAFEMNGKPIPADHGFPVRAVVPGYTAARQVKWLSEFCH
jgi:sulfite oxidase